MSEDYARATASPRPVMIGGRQFLVGKFNPRDLGDLQAFLKAHVPDPRLKARDLCRDLPDAVAIQIWRDLCEEAEEWPPSLGSLEGDQLLITTFEGNAHILWVALRRHNASIDLAAARKLAEDVTLDEINEVVRLGFPEPSFGPKGSTQATSPA